MIYQLVLFLLIITIIAYLINKKDIISPSVIFSASFLFSSIWALAFKDEWSLETFHLNTFLVIIGGVLIFLIISSITSFFSSKIKNNKKKIKANPEEININSIVKILCIIISTISVLIIIRSVLHAVGYSWNHMFEGISRFDSISKFSSTNIGISKLASFLKCFLTALSYWYLYIFMHNVILSKKIDLSSLIIVIIGFFGSMTTGGRNGAINLIIALVVYLILILNKKGTPISKIPLKTKLFLLLVPTIVLLSFPKLTALVGRNVSTTGTYYLAVYCGAEIKNLDIYLQEYNYLIKTNKNNMTFISINNWLGPKLGYTQPYKYDLPFRSVNGYNLGNVYTTFYAYIYDYGYVGVVTMVSLMAFIIQFVYEKAKKSNLTNKPSIWILIYGYMFSSIVLSFFSNKFYEQEFSIHFIYIIIFWLIFNKFFLRLKFKRVWE